MTRRTCARLTGNMLLMLLLLAPGFAAAAMPRCVQCGMMVDEKSAFSAKLTDGATTVHFCDIGDLLAYLKANKGPASAAVVKDYTSGQPVPAAAAYYVKSTKHFSTPMGWGIAAFRDRKDAEVYGAVLDLDTVIMQLK